MFYFIRPEFFDIFGVGVFGFIIFVSVWGLKMENTLPSWAFIILLIVGVAGFLIDSIIVYKTYLKKK